MAKAKPKEEKKGIVPKLRFPEFREAAGWEATTLGSLLTFGNGRDHQDLQDGEVPVYGSGGYMRSVSEHLYDGESVCIGRKGTIDNPIFLTGKFWAVDTLFYTHGFKDCLPKFIYYLFNRIVWRDYSEAGGLPSLAKTTISKIAVHTPSLAEQKKIADCLTSLDEVIAAQGQKVETLKAHKKGLMQQLFPREGETLPRLRFPEFEGQAEWSESSLLAICERIMDGTHFSPKTKTGPRPYMTSKNIRNGWLDLSTVSYISEQEHRDIYNRCPVKKHDVLLTKDGANTGNCAINTLDYEFSLLSSVAVLRGDSRRVIQEFLFQTIASERMQSTIINSMSGQAITRITLEKLGKYVISLPSLAEQKRIAECLSSLDERIEAEGRKLDGLKTHKKGLMQQLFPTSAEG